MEPEKRRQALSWLKRRYATCGACGTEWEVEMYMRTDREYQFTPRPEQRTDEFYCGCQADHDDNYGGSWWNPF